MPAPVTLDHLGLVGRDLASLLGQYRALGFAPTGPHGLFGRDPVSGESVWLQQDSAHLVFEAGYVELTAMVGDPPGHPLARHLRRHSGLHILALGVEDIAAARERTVAAGLAMSAPAAASRRIDYGQRRGEARFDWCMVEPAASPEGLLCLVCNGTPELVFQPEVQRHANGATALAGLYVLSEAPQDSKARLGALAALAVRHRAGRRLQLAGGFLEVCRPAQFTARFIGAAVPPAPCMAGFTVRVRDLAQARATVAAGGLECRPVADGGFWVDSTAAGGCVVEFTT